MKTTKTLLAAAILGMIAFAGNSHAQTVADSGTSGTWRDTSLSIPQRIALADAVVTNGTDAQAVSNAASYMLQARPVVHLFTAFPTFAESIIADPTLGGKTSDINLWARAVLWKVDSIADNDAKIAYVANALKSPLTASNMAGSVKVRYTQLIAGKAQKQLGSGDPQGAIDTVTPILGACNKDAIKVVFRAKISLRSPDVLQWAKLIYVTADFSNTQDGIDAVSSAFRCMDTGLARANAFIQFQKDGQGKNPIDGVSLPQGVTLIDSSTYAQFQNQTVTGNTLGALKAACNAFASASSAQLNAATALVAQALRNIDGNLVRANAFVTAQTNGGTFDIAELKN